MTRDQQCDNFVDDLRLIRTSWSDMLPPLPKRGIGPHVSISVGKEAPPPAPIATISLRLEVCQQLASWCQLVIEERDLQHTSLSGHDAMGMAGFLIVHADWLSHHEAFRSAVAEIGNLAGSCDDVAREVRRRRFPVGPCIGHVTDDEGQRTPCPGRMVAYLTTEQDVLPMLNCTLNPEHVWDGSRWHLLGKHECTVSDAARITRIPERTIREWIGQGKIPVVGKVRPFKVRLEDVTRNTKRAVA